jgi:hypothetical protein
MSVPPWAGFVADFPEDEVATRDKIEVYGGRNLAVALGQMFTSLGCTKVSEPWSAGEVGWEFDFDYRGLGFWCRVQSFHPIFWLLLESPSSNSERRSYPGAHFELWQKFASALEQDPRFDQIFWRARDQGPPDWDEFVVERDVPRETDAEDSSPAEIDWTAKRARLSAQRVIIGVWFVLTVIVINAIDMITHGKKEQSAYVPITMAALIVGLAILLRVVDRRRQSRDSGP